MNATIPVAAATTSSVQIPTVPVRLVPGVAVEVDATVWAERMFASAKPASGDAMRFLAGFVK